MLMMVDYSPFLCGLGKIKIPINCIEKPHVAGKYARAGCLYPEVGSL
jgi:hypothetical protein